MEVKRLLLAGVVVLGLALWIGYQFTLSPGSSDMQPVTASAAPDFTVSTLDGQVFTLSEHQGEVVAINFMVPGCPSCVPMLPRIARLQEEYGPRGVQVLVLNMDPFSYSDSDLLAFKIESGGGNELWANDLEQAVARSFGVRVAGSTYIIDRQGRLAYWTETEIPYESLKDEIEGLL